MTQKTSQHLFTFPNAFVYCQQKAFVTVLVSSGDLYFIKTA